MKHRLKEPSTYAGVGLVAHGIAEIFGAGASSAGAGEAAAQAVEQAASGNWYLAIASILAGAAALLGPERGAPDHKDTPKR